MVLKYYIKWREISSQNNDKYKAIIIKTLVMENFLIKNRTLNSQYNRHYYASSI